MKGLFGLDGMGASELYLAKDGVKLELKIIIGQLLKFALDAGESPKGRVKAALTGFQLRHRYFSFQAAAADGVGLRRQGIKAGRLGEFAFGKHRAPSSESGAGHS